MSSHPESTRRDVAAAALRRLRELVWVAPALILTVCFVPTLAAEHAATGELSLAIVRAWLDTATPGPSDQPDLPPPTVANSGVPRPVWSPALRSQPLAAEVVAWQPAADEPLLLASTDLLLAPPHPVVSEGLAFIPITSPLRQLSPAGCAYAPPIRAPPLG